MSKQETVVEAEVEVFERTTTDVAGAIAGLNNPDAAFYSSIAQDDFSGKLKVANAMSSSKAISDNIGVEFKLADFIVQSVQIADDETGVVEEAPRVTLIAEDGTAYHGTSSGLLSAVRNLISVLGEPATWPEGVNVKVVEERSRKGYRFMTIKFV